MKPNVGRLTASELEVILRDVVCLDIEPVLRQVAAEGVFVTCRARLCGAPDVIIPVVATGNSTDALIGEVRVGLFGALKPVRYEYQVLTQPHPETGWTGFGGKGRITPEGERSIAPGPTHMFQYNVLEFASRFR